MNNPVLLNHDRQGKRGLDSRMPWLIAFLSGLLHGLGFAGAWILGKQYLGNPCP
ncbi:MAG: hypothetical protein GWN45_08155 [Gammaproteobacteria bacterium]|nr:hypothetical protein [Gammaproteobacteria bacterium]